MARLASPYPKVEGSDVILQLEENQLEDVKTAMLGLVELFKVGDITQQKNCGWTKIHMYVQNALFSTNMLSNQNEYINDVMSMQNIQYNYTLFIKWNTFYEIYPNKEVSMLNITWFLSL